MIESSADTRRLSEVDAAGWVGRLADSVVVAISRQLTDQTLGEADRLALDTAARWLDRLSEQLAKPLDLTHIGGSADFPAVYNFGTNVTDAAIDALGVGADRDSEISALRSLSASVRDVEAGRGDSQTAEHLVAVFESIAEAMLSAAGSLLATPARRTWPTTFAI